MNFIQVSFPIQSQEADASEQALSLSGALAVTLQDAQDQPLLEPGVGETPIWDEAIIKALYPEETDCLSLISKLADSLPSLNLETIQFELIKDQPWERAWMIDFKPLCFGKNFWIYPSNIPVKPHHLALVLDPGLAFGTGTHPTTAMCLEYLATHPCDNKTLIDFGCGSGILALAALKLGASEVIALDNDPQALTATLENAKRNNLLDNHQLKVLDSLHTPKIQVDILIANILAGPLVNLAIQFSNLVKPQGRIVLSGILKNQANKIKRAYESYFESFDTQIEGDWVRIDAIRKNI